MTALFSCCLAGYLKFYLRGEPGPYYQDLFPLISFLPRYANESKSDMLPLWAPFEHLDDDPNAPRHASESHIRSTDDTKRAASLPDPSLTGESNENGEKAGNASWFNSRARKHKKKDFDPEQALSSVRCDKPLLVRSVAAPPIHK